jgi:molybdopterin biosynthesis enzyme MoaB
MMGWGAFLLGRKALVPLRDRVVVIDRVCARCGAEYEWGVHVAAFAKAAGFTPAQTAAIADPDADDAALTERDRLLVAMVDELHDTSDVSDSLWKQLEIHYDPPQLIELVDAGCSLVLTTGGTGPAPRDVTPEATLAIAHKEMPGFGEQMRQVSLRFVPTAILSRQVAVIRGQSLIINLPGQPKSIQETLEGLKEDGRQVVPGIFAAVPYCIDLIGGPYLETNDEVCKVFRPKSAIRQK